MDKLLSRQDIIKKLEKYVSGIITLRRLQNWQEKMLKNNFEPTDWDGDESFVNEVINIIDMSDIDGLPIRKTKGIIKLLKSKKNTKILIKRLYQLN
jgi:hypothetical protein